MQALSASLVAAMLGLAVLSYSTDGFSALTTETARRLQAVRDAPAMPRVEIETMTGEVEVLPAEAQATVVEFIYTTCPDICQSAGALMARLRDRLSAHSADAQRVRLVSLSFDTERDDPARLAAYGRRHGADGADWTVARVRHSQDLRRLLNAYGVTVIPDRRGGFVHNTALHVVGPDGRLVAIKDMDDLDGVEAAVVRGLQ